MAFLAASKSPSLQLLCASWPTFRWPPGCRGIDVVRNKIKMFAQKKVTLPPGRHKIVILDEGDSMTSAAQQALRRTMEIYSNTTRFAIACNQSSKVIEPIQSRCAIVRFTKISEEHILSRLMQVPSVAHSFACIFLGVVVGRRLCATISAVCSQ